MSSETSQPTVPFRYPFALGATALVMMVAFLLSRALGDPAPVTLFIVASVVSAWYGGLGPGLLATALTGAAGCYFVLEPIYSLAVHRPSDWVRLGIFLAVGGVVSWLSEALHRARRRAGDEARQAREVLAQLETERARLYTVLESIPAGVVVAEAPSGRIVLGNSQAERVLGHSLIPTPDLDSYRQWYGYDLKGRRLEADEYPLVRAIRGEVLRDEDFLYEPEGGPRRCLRVSSVPIRDGDGNITGGVVLFTDVSQERQGQEGFRRSQERLNLAQKAARIGHFEWNIQTNENIWSEEIEALYGLPPGSFGGTYEKWAERVLPEDLPRAESDLRRSLVDGEFSSEWRTVLPDGTIRWLRARAQVFFDEAGRPLRMVGINMDVTDLKQAEGALRASELRLELALAAARMGIWHLDLATGELSCSASCKANFGRSPDLPFGYGDLLEAIHPDDREEMQAAVRRAVEEQVEYRADYRVLWPDGSLHWIAARGRTTYEDGRPVFMDGVTVDLTERKSLEESLRRQTEALQEADRHKNEFLAILAHELRNPLAPLHNTLQILALRGDDPAVVAQARELMGRQLQQMVRLVDDLLEVSRISRGKVKLEKTPLDLAGVVAAAVETSRPLVEARRHDLRVTLPAEPVWIEADPARLAQVLSNLLNNAAKYTDVGGRIELTAGREDGKAVLRVRDTGVGLAPEMLPRVFDLFTQVESTLDRSQGGLGLGLTLVRRLVEMHGGTVEAHSDGIGRGSEFVVRLPALAGESQTSPEHSTAAAETTGAWRILIVDDNVDSAESLAMLLELSGHEVRLAHDGEAALDEVRAFSPDVVLLDIGLPKLDGYGVARRLHEGRALNGTVLIAMTGYGQEEDRRRSREAGFHHHLVKPLDLEALRGLLANLSLPGAA